jgi:hypothetical protein
MPSDIIAILANKNDIITLRKLHTMLTDLIYRCKTSPNRRALIIPGGARRFTKMIKIGDLWFLQEYADHICSVIKNLQNQETVQKVTDSKTDETV